MACRDITLPKCLLDFIDRHMPRVNGAARVGMHCCPEGQLPFDRLIKKVGIAYFGNIYIADRFCPQPFDPCALDKLRLLFHEFAHIEQEEEEPLFYLLYLFSWLYSHLGGANRFETAADARAAQLLDRYKAENPCGCEDPTWGETGGAGTGPQPPTGPARKYSLQTSHLLDA